MSSVAPPIQNMSSSAAQKGKTIAQYGAWKSPITAEVLTQKNVSFGEIAVPDRTSSTAKVVYTENRPEEKGRAALVKMVIDLDTLETKRGVQQEQDLSKGDYNVRSGVHEYGGGALAVSGSDKLIFTDYKTFDVFEVEGDGEAKKLTPENKLHRFADFCTHPHEPFIICVREDHTIDTPSQVVNSLVCIDRRDSSVFPLITGADFYSAPRLSPDGKSLAWVSWNHPSMPFFATQLWVAPIRSDTRSRRLEIGKEKLIGTKGADEVSHHPVWADNSTLLFGNDSSGFANLYKVRLTGVEADINGLQLGPIQPLCHEVIKSEFLTPQWVLNESNFVPLEGAWLACHIVTKAISSLALVHIETGEFRRLNTPFVGISQLRQLGPQSVIFAGQQSDEPVALVVMDLSDAVKGVTDVPRWKIIKRSSNVVEEGIVPREYLTKAEVIEFPTELPSRVKTTAHAVIFPPRNPDYVAPAGTYPPCIVKIHGGPTAAANSGLNLLINYWTTRGYMICMVNYGGSTGYGREYVLRLDGQWGVVDVRDAVAAATFLGSTDHNIVGRQERAHRRISQQGQSELSRLSEKVLPSGAIEAKLENPGSWIPGVADALVATSFVGASFFVPGMQLYHGLVASGLAWLYRNFFHIWQESVLAIPSVGLQLTTLRGFRLPLLLGGQFYTTSKQTKMIPRDCILDVFTNEAFRRWSVVDYIAVSTQSPSDSKHASRGGRLDVLFPNLLPRLPVVERVYRLIYPAIFGHEVPSKVSSASDEANNIAPRADPEKIAISGGSAGGYTVLASLCLYPRAFSAGTSSYGVSDVAALDAESHKFESRYTERLMGGTPATKPDIYHDRSPIYMADRIVSPVLLLQGDLDKVVPPEQSESIYKVLQENGTKSQYVLFEGEGHGFRMASSIKRALQAEEAWYQSCFGIALDAE